MSLMELMFFAQHLLREKVSRNQVWRKIYDHVGDDVCNAIMSSLNDEGQFIDNNGVVLIIT